MPCSNYSENTKESTSRGNPRNLLIMPTGKAMRRKWTSWKRIYKDTFIRRSQNQSAHFYLSLLCVRLRYHFQLRSFEKQILMYSVWIPFGFVFWQFTIHQIDSCHIHSQPQVWCPGLFHLIIPGNITEPFNRLSQIRQVVLNTRLMKFLWSLPPHTSLY